MNKQLSLQMKGNITKVFNHTTDDSEEAFHMVTVIKLLREAFEDTQMVTVVNTSLGMARIAMADSQEFALHTDPQ